MGKVSVEDRVLIRELYDRFYWAMNDGDRETQIACFLPDGYLEKYSGEISTPEHSAATGFKWSRDPVGRTYQHHVTNVIVEPDPEGREDHRAVRMYFLVTGVWEPPQIIIRWSCKSHDDLQLVDGEWLFNTRKVTLNHDSTGPHWSNEPEHAEAPAH
jgi:hypothetical protein